MPWDLLAVLDPHWEPAAVRSAAALSGAAHRAFERKFDLYPAGVVSLVSDTDNLWNVLTNLCERLTGVPCAQSQGGRDFMPQPALGVLASVSAVRRTLLTDAAGEGDR
jgi:hypothetical protein